MSDWMKIEKKTPEKREVIAIAARLDTDPDLVFGKLFKVWRWFDDNTTDGNAPSVTPAHLDRLTGQPKLADAMLQVGWLTLTKDGLTLPNFDRHNGNSSKKRALTAERVSKSRVKQEAECNAPSVTKALPDKIRLDNTKNIATASAAAQAVGVTSGTKPKSPHQTTVDHFCERWKACHEGETYPFTSKDGQHVKTLLKHADADKLKRVIDRYLADQDKFVTDDQHGLGLLVSRLRRYLSDKPSLASAGVIGPKMSRPGEFGKQVYNPG